MTFIADNQTLDELNITGKYKRDSIFNIFNNTHTAGGEQLMEDMFQHPLSDAAQINQRSAVFSYFQQREIPFPFEKQLLEDIELYVSRPCRKNKIAAMVHICRQKFMNTIAHDKELEITHSGCLKIIGFLNTLQHFLHETQDLQYLSPYTKILDTIIGTSDLQKTPVTEQLSLKQLFKYDHIFKCACAGELKKLLELAYLLDVYLTVGKIAKEKQLSIAKAMPKVENESFIRIENLFHPSLSKPVSNSINICSKQNVFFLTGANMAGKSTFIKSVGIAVYTAHMGFPVAAENMEFTIQDGIYTSINAPDNLNEGYSHFYAEVLRIKKIAGEVCPKRNLVVLLDELYKGTNVKDAYDATVAVTEAFASIHSCFYVVSSHITESGHSLQERCPNMMFYYLPSFLEGSTPRYTHKLEAGITNDCHGMAIIRNEHILEILGN